MPGNRGHDSGLAELTIRGFLDQLASDSPTPGGGTAAAFAGACAAALGEMVCRIGLRKETEGVRHVQLTDHATGFSECRAALLRLADQDALAFDLVMKAFRLPKNTDVERHARREAVSIASIDAATVPGRSADQCLRVLRRLETLVPLAPGSTLSDVACSALLAGAGLRSAVQNVRTNLGSIEDPNAKSSLGHDADAVESAASQLEFTVMNLLAERRKK